MTPPSSSSWFIQVQAEATHIRLRAQRSEHEELRSIATSVDGAVDELAAWLRGSPRGNFEVVVASGAQRQTHATTSASIALHFVVNALENLMFPRSQWAGHGSVRARDPETHGNVHRIMTSPDDTVTSPQSKITAAE